MSEPVDLLAALNAAVNRARDGYRSHAHDHAERVAGCFRCDLSAKEADDGA